MTRYYVIDGTNTALRYMRNNIAVSIEVWKINEWVDAPVEYHGIFSDDVSIEPIEVGDDTWMQLGLNE